jgi:hypothetical protein
VLKKGLLLSRQLSEMFPSNAEKVYLDVAGKFLTWTMILGVVLAYFGQKIGQIILKRLWQYFLTL